MSRAAPGRPKQAAAPLGGGLRYSEGRGLK